MQFVDVHFQSVSTVATLALWAHLVLRWVVRITMAGVGKCNVVKCNVVQCNVVKCNVVQCNVAKCNMVKFCWPFRQCGRQPLNGSIQLYNVSCSQPFKC